MRPQLPGPRRVRITIRQQRELGLARRLARTSSRRRPHRRPAALPLLPLGPRPTWHLRSHRRAARHRSPDGEAQNRRRLNRGVNCPYDCCYRIAIGCCDRVPSSRQCYRSVLNPSSATRRSCGVRRTRTFPVMSRSIRDDVASRKFNCPLPLHLGDQTATLQASLSIRSLTRPGLNAYANCAINIKHHEEGSGTTSREVISMWICLSPLPTSRVKNLPPLESSASKMSGMLV